MPINKVLHLYWGRNRPLSFLRALTVWSFHKLNPSWRIKIWVPDVVSFDKPWSTGEQSDKYFGHDYLTDLSYTMIHVVPFKVLGIPDETPEVHKADLLRWHLLGTEGGVWSDFDILYINPISNTWLDKVNGAGLCRYEADPLAPRKLYQAIGFLTSHDKAGKDFFSGLFKLGVSRIPQSGYQAFGANLLDQYLLMQKDNYFYLPPSWVYPYATYVDIPAYFHNVELVRDGVIGYHWYAGNPKNAPYEADITPHNIEFKASSQSICKEALRICPLNTLF